MSVSVCFTRCYSCMLGHHFDPPRVHTWGDPEDFEWAADNGQPEPGSCPCACGRVDG